MSATESGLSSVKRELKELQLLLEISQILDRSMDLREVVGPVLEALARHMEMLRGTLALVNRETGEIQVDAAHGLSESQKEKGRYRLGEGVTGKVIQSGKPAVVPRVSQEPMFLNRTGARSGLRKKDIAFICIPIKIGNEILGALSADRLLPKEVSLDEDLRVMQIIGSMIAQAVRLRQSAQEEKQKLAQENQRLQEELKDKFRPGNIIGNSKQMQDVYDQIAQVCRSQTTVLIRGESGTGKELVAHAIHYNSDRAGKPFIRVNCAALPETLVESELFGHEKGAFTGALAARQGRFELANGGTIFLDEVGDFSPATQVKLLRVLQEREFERVGGSTPIKTDVRVIAATNRDLEAMISEGKFRQDLYYRLNVFSIHLPALRERKADILLLSDFFVEKYVKANRRSVKRISTPAIDMLMSYHWPGNVRELENCIERAVLVSNDEVIHGYHLPPTLQTAEASGTVTSGPLQAALDNVEREMITESLKSCRGNMAKAARILGMTERLMGLRVKKHGIDSRRFRSDW
ncbi:MAG TPA: nif-specific transcriptional activator NifA [Planctomycetota bacterium]|nr:nif-specific transcriptional activator NifA [Planctomycetota bacterium]